MPASAHGNATLCSTKCKIARAEEQQSTRTRALTANRGPCVVCGGPIPAKAHWNVKTCSLECGLRRDRAKARNVPTPVTTRPCVVCGVSMTAPAWRRTCGPACRARNGIAHIEKHRDVERARRASKVPMCEVCGGAIPLSLSPGRHPTVCGAECDTIRDKRWRRRHAARRYGVSMDQIEEMERNQGGVCAICAQPGELVIDHDHVTGAFRGLLCDACNLGIGHFKDDAGIVGAAIRYLLASAPRPLAVVK